MSTHVRPAVVERWHHIVEHSDEAALDDLIADDAVFYSPAVFTPQEGRDLTLAYLRAALAVFTGRTSGTSASGTPIDRRCSSSPPISTASTSTASTWRTNDAGQITSFKVMIRRSRACRPSCRSWPPSSGTRKAAPPARPHRWQDRTAPENAPPLRTNRP